jgi:hypothetical protein
MRWNASMPAQMSWSCTTDQFPEPAMIQRFGYAAPRGRDPSGAGLRSAPGAGRSGFQQSLLWVGT